MLSSGLSKTSVVILMLDIHFFFFIKDICNETLKYNQRVINCNLFLRS